MTSSSFTFSSTPITAFIPSTYNQISSSSSSSQLFIPIKYSQLHNHLSPSSSSSSSSLHLSFSSTKQNIRPCIHRRKLSSFDYEPSNNDDNNIPQSKNNKDEIIDNDKNNNNNDFLNFDDDSFLTELMEFSDNDNDHDDDENIFDLEGELEELERLIDEQTHSDMMNQTNNDNGNNNNMNNKKMDRIKLDDDKKSQTSQTPPPPPSSSSSSSALEEALLQGVVPAAAGVGSNCLPGDYGFDPLGLSTKDYFKQAQNFFLNLLPSSETKDKDIDGKKEDDDVGGAALPLNTKPSAPLYNDSKRPLALILRDYREAEIRHGRLAMLAAILWPLQEIIDRLFIPQSFGHTTMVYGGVTLPFVSLFMTLTMLLLGYLDIYAESIKANESGDAFLPGECFWDPLSMLDGAPDSMKRKMQERELNNGRMAMIAVLSYILQEAIMHEPVINLPWNQVLFEPAFEIPEVQAWLDMQFAGGTDIVDNFDYPLEEISDT